MCTVVHLEPEDFARELVHNPKNVYARTYVLDCGLAVVIYMCQDSHFLYYLDGLFERKKGHAEINEFL